MKVAWHINSWKKIIYFSLTGIHSLQPIYWAYLGTVFENLTKKVQSFKKCENFRGSTFPFGAIDPSEKDEYKEKL